MRQRDLYYLPCLPQVLCGAISYGVLCSWAVLLPPSAASLMPSLPVVDVSEDVEVDGDWLLSGQTKLPSPRIRINETALPVNGNYIEYHATGVCTSPCSSLHSLQLTCTCSLPPTILSHLTNHSHLTRSHHSHASHTSCTPYSLTSLTHLTHLMHTLLAHITHTPHTPHTHTPFSPSRRQSSDQPRSGDLCRTCSHGPVHMAAEQAPGHASATPHEAGEGHLVSHW